ncbi:MAG: Type 1 glutamine amidotransferase-like domain-containing protein [Acholeplasmataceae bacterium]|nr:Type 1 glutamine amidotransferase-like domain-containing protein [Acholeplasmataceae bacterium]
MTHILLSRGIIGNAEMVDELKDIIKSEFRVCIIAFSFFDKHINSKEAYDLYYKKGGEYYQKMIDSFAPYGIKENQISWVYYYDDTKEMAHKKINEVEIIYFPGGSPDLMMKRIIEFDLKELLESKDKIFIGSSAGAMIQFDDYHISKDVDYDCFSLQEGLSLINEFIVEVHYRRRKTQKSALRKMHRLTHKNIYGIPDDGAIIYHNKEIKTINTALQLYNKKGVIRK